MLLAAARAPQPREHPPLWLLAVARSVGAPSRRAFAWLRRRLPPAPEGRRLPGVRRPSAVVATAAVPPGLLEEDGGGGGHGRDGGVGGGGGEEADGIAGEARGFRLHGWRWHHVAIGRELAAIATALGSGVDCGDPSAVAAVVDAFAFARRSVWAVHNTMEREVLFPWIDTGVCAAAADGGRGPPTVTAVSRRGGGGGDGGGGGGGGVAGRSPARQRAVSAALSSFTAERERLEAAASDVEARLARLTAATADRDAPWRGVAACGPETARAAAAVRVLAAEAAALFAAEEAALIPLVTGDFSADEQARVFLTAVHGLAGGLRGPTAKLQLVLFHEALKAGGGGEEWGHFKREVPRPARAWIPVWKKRLYDGCPTTVLAERARERRLAGGRAAGRR